MTVTSNSIGGRDCQGTYNCTYLLESSYHSSQTAISAPDAPNEMKGQLLPYL